MPQPRRAEYKTEYAGRERIRRARTITADALHLRMFLLKSLIGGPSSTSTELD
jgi:hypothetical protein